MRDPRSFANTLGRALMVVTTSTVDLPMRVLVTEPPRTAIPFDDAGRTRGLEDAKKTAVAEHAFMRDEGPRWDPEASDQAFERGVSFLRRHLVVAQ